MEENTVVKCTDCGSRNLDEDFVRGERSCLDCGLVLAENIIDPGQEWTDYDGDKSRARAGPPTSVLWHDKGLSTDIHWSNTDFAGKRIVGASEANYSVCVSGNGEQEVSPPLNATWKVLLPKCLVWRVSWT